jgi:hypothetical protein
MPTGGGDAAPADSGADASVRPAGRPARTRLSWLYCLMISSLTLTGQSHFKVVYNEK